MALASERENSLFNAALAAGFAADGQRQLRSEMAMVTNQVLVARSVDYGDLEAVHVAVEMTHNYLNLALEHLASGDLECRGGKSARHSPAVAVSSRRQPDDRFAHARAGSGDAARARSQKDARDRLPRYAVSRGARGLHAASAALLRGARQGRLDRDARFPLDARSPHRLCAWWLRSKRCANCSARCSMPISRRRRSAPASRATKFVSARSC